jgi:hypothetical protein
MSHACRAVAIALVISTAIGHPTVSIERFQCGVNVTSALNETVRAYMMIMINHESLCVLNQIVRC